MAKTRAQKEGLLEKYKSLLTENQGFIALDSKGVDNVVVTELKKQLKEIGSNLTVVKNNIFKIAAEETKQVTEASAFDGQTAIITYSDDPTVIAKMVKTVQDETELLEARYGIIDGEYIDSDRVMQLAEIPSREELIAKMLGSMTSPVTGFMSVATGNARGLVQVLKQISEGSEDKEAA